MATIIGELLSHDAGRYVIAVRNDAGDARAFGVCGVIEVSKKLAVRTGRDAEHKLDCFRVPAATLRRIARSCVVDDG